MPKISDTDIRPAKIKKLLALLPPSQRENAAAVLAQNDGHSLGMLTDILTRERSRRQKRALLMLAPGILMVLARLIALVNPMPPTYILLAGICGMTLILLSPLNRRPTALEQAALDALVFDADKNSIGPLLAGLQLFALPADLYQKSRQRLIEVLQDLAPGDAALLTSVQHSQLQSHLDYIQRDNDLELRLATLNALQNMGDQACLGTIYKLATGEAATHTAQTVRQAAQDCIEQMRSRLDFGPHANLPAYIDSLIRQRQQSEELDFQIYAVGMLALRQLLPQLTAANYYQVLSQTHREHLYRLLTVTYAHYTINPNRYGNNLLREEIVRTIQRAGDTRALPMLRKVALFRDPTQGLGPLQKAVRETIPLLEARLEKEKESQTLLRGASSPAPAAGELLRAAAPAETVTAPTELLRAATPYQRQEPVKTGRSPEEIQHIGLPRTEDPTP